jgi:hypothetical protein
VASIETESKERQKNNANSILVPFPVALCSKAEEMEANSNQIWS